MAHVLDFIAGLGLSYTGIGFGVTVCAALFALESVLPLRRLKRPRRERVPVNLCMWAFVFVTGTGVRLAALWVADWASDSGFGLLNWIPVPLPVALAVGVLLMDYSFYWWHRFNHTVPFLWLFHNVHHVDPDLDVSTTFRYHFAEIFFSTALRVLQVAVIGVSPSIYVVYELCLQLGALFQHSNLRLPIGAERALNTVLVTPRMHGIHHSGVRSEMASNYSTVFRWWDRLHRTLRLDVPQGKVDVGVPAYQEPGDNRLWVLLVLPFLPQREYWRRPDGTQVSRETLGPGARPGVLRE